MQHTCAAHGAEPVAPYHLRHTPYAAHVNLTCGHTHAHTRGRQKSHHRVTKHVFRPRSEHQQQHRPLTHTDMHKRTKTFPQTRRTSMAARTTGTCTRTTPAVAGNTPRGFHDPTAGYSTSTSY